MEEMGINLNKNKLKSVIITGPTGILGNALIEICLQYGTEVYAVVRPDSKRIKDLPRSPHVHIVECGLNEIKSLPSKIGKSPDTFDVFYHFGWDGTFGNSRNNTKGQIKNIEYSIDAVETANELHCRRFIGAGSQAEYGRVEGKLSSKTPTFPETGYGIAKLCAGQMTRLRCEQLGVDHIWTRILSLYGPHDGNKTMIMSTIGSLLKGEEPSLTEGKQQWDYLFSKDAGRAMYLLGINGIPGKTYCLGSGEANPLLTYIETIRDLIDPDAKLGIGKIPYSPKQVMYLCADIEDLKEDTGFSPEYSFYKGAQETIQWYRKNCLHV